MRSPFKLLLVSVFVNLACGHFSYAQTYPADFAQVLVVSGIANPTAMAFAPDGRIFVCEQAGSLRVVKNGALLASPFVSISVNSTGDSGLMGIALDPDFSINKYLYLYYTTTSTPANNRISRFTANGDVVQAGSEVVILELDPLGGSTNHIGGAMHFGNDGKLYVATGENSNSANSQNLDTYHGKLLRINSDGSVPSGNPFLTGSEQRKRVWAYGLRNPYTFAVDRGTGRILVNDVGLLNWEEINDATAGGKNFGWPTTDGNFDPGTYPAFTNPTYVYAHGDGDGIGCAITGGTFFSPTTTNYPAAYVGKYFFQDYCNDWINTLDLSGSNAVRAPFATTVALTGLAISQGTDGNLYFLSRNLGSIFKIIYNKTTAPFIMSQPSSLIIAEGQSATFSISALGSAPLIYQWKRNGVNIPGATNATFKVSSATLADNGAYKVTVSNGSGSATCTEAMLTVIANSVPVAKIVTPASGSTYVAGTSISFSGVGSDKNGALAPSALSWALDFHHDVHKHDEPPITGISSGSFFIPNEGETSDNVWYRIILTVTDGNGLKGKDSVDVYPRKSTMKFVTNPPGLRIALDGQPIETPVSVVSVEGLLRSIGIISPQVKDDVTYTFESWSNGGSVTQTFATPTEDVTLSAMFSTVVGTEDRSYDESVSVFPNPSQHGQVMIRIPSSREQKAMVRMVDLLSRDIITVEEELHTGINDVSFYYGKIKMGIYQIVVQLTDRTIIKKLVVAD